MNIKSHRYYFTLFFVLITKSIYAQESIYEKNIDMETKNAELKASILEKDSNKSSFYPELNIVTGLGSEYTKDKSETEKGGILYLDSKINLYNGSKDKNSLNISDSKIAKTKIERTLEQRKVQINAYKIIQEIEALTEENKLIDTEKENNKKQSNWAKKKADAGLTTNADLLDFQIKETNLNNELSINKLKISENETELLNLFGNGLSLNEIINNIKSTENELNLKDNTPTTLNEMLLLEDLRISNYELQKSKSGFLPKLDLEAKAGNITPTSKILSDKSEHQIALTLTIPLFSGFSTQTEVQKSVNEKAIKEKSLRNYQNNISSIIELEKRKIDLNKNLLKNQEDILLKAIKFYEQTINEYKRGIKNSSDLISSSDRVLELKIKTQETKKEIKTLTYNLNLNLSI